MNFRQLSAMNFIDAVIGMNFAILTQVILKRKIPTNAMKNPPVITTQISKNSDSKETLVALEFQEFYVSTQTGHERLNLVVASY